MVLESQQGAGRLIASAFRLQAPALHLTSDEPGVLGGQRVTECLGPASQLRHPSTCLLKRIWLYSAFLTAILNSHILKYTYTYTEHMRTFCIWFLKCNGFACFVIVSCTRCRNAETYRKENQLQQKQATSHCCRFFRDR